MPDTLRTIATSALQTRREQHAAAVHAILMAECVISTTYVSAERQAEVHDLLQRKLNCEMELRRRGAR
jgi:hypothetical protein